jgi:hypothetical protein
MRTTKTQIEITCDGCGRGVYDPATTRVGDRQDLCPTCVALLKKLPEDLYKIAVAEAVKAAIAKAVRS